MDCLNDWRASAIDGFPDLESSKKDLLSLLSSDNKMINSREFFIVSW